MQSLVTWITIVDNDEIDVRIKMQKEIIKDAMKDALKEWLDEKFLTFGKWSLGAMAAAGLVAFAWLMLVSHGWELKK
jgi:hypothetical protein